MTLWARLADFFLCLPWYGKPWQAAAHLACTALVLNLIAVVERPTPWWEDEVAGYGPRYIATLLSLG